jgi:hypothetical protein
MHMAIMRLSRGNGLATESLPTDVQIPGIGFIVVSGRCRP